jgi:hypothetical protein
MNKKLLSFVFLSLSFLVWAQPTLVITNTSASNSITCSNPTVGLTASVSNFNGSVRIYGRVRLIHLIRLLLPPHSQEPTRLQHLVLALLY